MNRLILLSYQTLGKKSSEFYIIQKRRFIHRKLQVLATMNHLILLYYQTLGQKVKPLTKYLLLHFVSIWGILILRNIHK